MSLFEKASIIVTPNATKEDIIYGIKGTHLDFVRATNATRVNANKMVELSKPDVPRLDYTDSPILEPKRTNLLTHSEGDLSTNSIDLNVTDAVTSIDGFSNSIQFNNTDASYAYRAVSLDATKIHTFSVFVEMEDGSAPICDIQAALGNFVFNITSSSATGTYVVTLIRGNIYRVSVTQIPTGNNVSMGIIRYNTQILKAFKITGFQMEEGNTLTSYIPTTTTTVTREVSVGCPSILIEPEATNLEETSNSGSYGNPPGSEILAISPDGTNNAIRPVPDADSDRYEYQIEKNVYSSGDKLTYSWYRKRFSTPAENSTIIGDLNIRTLVNCAQIGNTIKIQTNINGYDRFSATIEITDGSLQTILRIYFYDAIGIGNSSVAYWGHQLEVGSYATSLILTTNAAVTRNEEAVGKIGVTTLFNSEEGVLYCEIAAFSNNSTGQYIAISDVGNTQIRVGYLSGKIYIQVRISNVVIYTHSETVTLTNFNKVAFSWTNSTQKVFVNGALVDSESEDTTISTGTLNSLDLGIGSIPPFYGKLKGLQVYKTALTDAELIKLTT